MTFSKSCQVELVFVPAIMKHLIEEGTLMHPPPELMACACRAKHLLIIKADEMYNNGKVKFRLCDFHFNYLRQKCENEATNDTILLCRFRRNKL